MFFSKNKKLQRDRNAGLVFRWRGGYAMNRGGSMIAFLITASIFAGSFTLLNVSAKRNIIPSRYRASMIQLGKMDDELRWWVEKNSPNLPVWNEDEDGLSDMRVNALLVEKLKEASSSAYAYEDVEMKQVEIDNEALYALSKKWLPPAARFKVKDAELLGSPVPVDWKLNIHASDALATRMPDTLVYDDWISEKWHGRSVKLIVAVDVRGKVLSVIPADWTEDLTVKEFENWVYTISFKPANKEQSQTVTGVIRLNYLPIIKSRTKEGKNRQ